MLKREEIELPSRLPATRSGHWARVRNAFSFDRLEIDIVDIFDPERLRIRVLDLFDTVYFLPYMFSYL